jgi:hypothetical protein
MLQCLQYLLQYRWRELVAAAALALQFVEISQVLFQTLLLLLLLILVPWKELQ